MISLPINNLNIIIWISSQIKLSFKLKFIVYGSHKQNGTTYSIMVTFKWKVPPKFTGQTQRSCVFKNLCHSPSLCNHELEFHQRLKSSSILHQILNLFLPHGCYTKTRQIFHSEEILRHLNFSFQSEGYRQGQTLPRTRNLNKKRRPCFVHIRLGPRVRVSPGRGCCLSQRPRYQVS